MRHTTPFLAVPYSLLAADVGLTLTEKLMWCYLASLFNASGGDAIWVTYRKLAEVLGCSRLTAIRSAKALEENGVIASYCENGVHRITYVVDPNVAVDAGYIKDDTEDDS